MRDRKQATPN